MQFVPNKCEKLEFGKGGWKNGGGSKTWPGPELVGFFVG
jgi:hypothetical protein